MGESIPIHQDTWKTIDWSALERRRSESMRIINEVAEAIQALPKGPEESTFIPPTSFGAGFYARGDDPKNYESQEHAEATNRHERRRADALLRKGK